MSAKTGNNALAAVFGVVGALLLLAALGIAMNNGHDDDSVLVPPGGPGSEELRLVIFTAYWGHFEPDDEGIQRFRPDSRELTITVYVNGERLSGFAPDDPSLGVWHHMYFFSPGTEVRLLVEQLGQGGFLLCQITADGEIVAPNGYMHRNDAGDCDAEGVVP